MERVSGFAPVVSVYANGAWPLAGSLVRQVPAAERSIAQQRVKLWGCQAENGTNPLCQYTIDSWPPGIKTQRVDRKDTGYWITRLRGNNCSRSRSTRRGRATRASPGLRNRIRK